MASVLRVASRQVASNVILGPRWKEALDTRGAVDWDHVEQSFTIDEAVPRLRDSQSLSRSTLQAPTRVSPRSTCRGRRESARTDLYLVTSTTVPPSVWATGGTPAVDNLRDTFMRRGSGPGGMAVSPVTEPCDTCESSTPHEVRVEVREAGEPSKHAEYSRQPYRIAVCQRCGERQDHRVNTA